MRKLIDIHLVKERRREDIDSLRHLRTVGADNLRAEQAACAEIPRHSKL
jgi:hypothetical protein